MPTPVGASAPPSPTCATQPIAPDSPPRSRESHVFLQSYRPGSLEAFGFGPADAARLRPGIVCVSLSAYGRTGPWSARRGFDSLVQTATGFNDAEARATGSTTPRPLPMQLLDMASAFLLAFGTEAALLRQQAQGGSWHVQVSLARTALWLRSLGRVADGFSAPPPEFSAQMEAFDSGFGRLAGAAPRGALLGDAGAPRSSLGTARNRSPHVDLRRGDTGHPGPGRYDVALARRTRARIAADPRPRH